MDDFETHGRPHPLLNLAAALAILAGIASLGAASGIIAGRKPHTESAPPAVALGDELCAECGVVESVRSVEVSRDAAGSAAVAGSAVAAMARRAAGDVGERALRPGVSYRVTVRMADGSRRSVYRSDDLGVGVGQKVRLVDGELIAPR
ncbi:MAG: hypothetical protein HY778_18145 [Betaproteobacteria bacterium]|nr:hypothetical protein [Betaproteobacteria bacterium]